MKALCLCGTLYPYAVRTKTMAQTLSQIFVLSHSYTRLGHHSDNGVIVIYQPHLWGRRGETFIEFGLKFQFK